MQSYLDEAEEAYRQALYEHPDDAMCMYRLMYTNTMLYKDYIAVELGNKLLDLMEDGELKYYAVKLMMSLYSRNDSMEKANELMTEYADLINKYEDLDTT